MTERTSVLPQIVGHAVRYFTATFVFQIVTFAAGLVTKRYLGPVNVGIWASLALVTTYLDFVQFRITDAAQKEIAYRRGRGEQSTVELLRDVMFTVWLTVSVVLGLGMIIVGWVVVPGLSTGSGFVYRVGFLVVGATYPVVQLVNCITVMFRCHKRFELLSRTLVILAVANAVLQILLTVVWGFYGFMLASVIAQIFNVLYWRFWIRDKELTHFRLRWHWPTLRRLLEVGIPWEAGLIVGTLFRSLDQVILVSALGPATLGLYSIGVSMNNYVYNVPNAVSVVTFPNFQERYGQTDSPAVLLNLIRLPVLTMAFVILPIAVGGLYLFSPTLIRQILPEFTASIPVVQVLAIGTFALSLNHMPGQFMLTINRQWPAVALGAVSVCVLATGVYLALHLNLGIAGVAAATAVSYTFSSATLLFLAVTLASSWQVSLSLLFKCGVAMGWTWLALTLTDRWQLFGVSTWPLDFGSSAIKFCLFLVLALPLFWYFERTTGMLKMVFQAVRVRFDPRLPPPFSGHAL